MADNTVTTKFVTDPRDEVLLQLLKQQKETTNLQKRMLSLAKTSKRGSKTATSGFGATTLSIIKAQLSVSVLTGGIKSAFQNMGNLRREAEQTAVAMDKSAKTLRIQAGFTKLQSEEAQTRVGEIAKESGVPQEVVNRIATEAASQGVAAPLASGVTGALVEFVQSTGKDPANTDVETLMGGIAQLLRSENKQLTGANVKQLLTRTRGLFKSTPFQPEDLAPFSGAAKIATVQGLSQEEFLGAAAVAKSGENKSEKAATGLRNFITILGTKTKSAKAGFKELGIDQTQVDLIGETYPEALKTLGDALNKLPDERRLPVLSKIFGRETTGAALDQIKAVQDGTFQKFIKLERDTSGFRQGVNVARSGLSAGLAKGEAVIAEIETQTVAEGGITLKEAEQQFTIDAKRRAKSAQGSFFKQMYNALLTTGGEADLFEVRQGFNTPEDILSDKQEAAILKRRQAGSPPPNEVRELTEAMRENTKEMKNQTDKPQPVEVVNEPQRRRPVAAAALSN